MYVNHALEVVFVHIRMHIIYTPPLMHILQIVYSLSSLIYTIVYAHITLYTLSHAHCVYYHHLYTQ